MAHTVSHTNLKIGQVNRQIYKVPHLLMLESGRVRLVRPSAVIITHKKWVPSKTLENFIHKDRPRNVEWFHYIDFLRKIPRARAKPRQKSHTHNALVWYEIEPRFRKSVDLRIFRHDFAKTQKWSLGPKNGLERRVWQFYTICDKNQLLKVKIEIVTVILVLISWDASCRRHRALWKSFHGALGEISKNQL